MAAGRHAITPERKPLSIKVLSQNCKRMRVAFDRGNLWNAHKRRCDGGRRSGQEMAQEPCASRTKALFPCNCLVNFSLCKSINDYRDLIPCFSTCSWPSHSIPNRTECAGKLSCTNATSSKLHCFYETSYGASLPEHSKQETITSRNSIAGFYCKCNQWRTLQNTDMHVDEPTNRVCMHLPHDFNELNKMTKAHTCSWQCTPVMAQTSHVLESYMVITCVPCEFANISTRKCTLTYHSWCFTDPHMYLPLWMHHYFGYNTTLTLYNFIT